MTKIFLVDDHPLFRAGIRQSLAPVHGVLHRRRGGQRARRVRCDRHASPRHRADGRRAARNGRRDRDARDPPAHAAHARADLLRARPDRRRAGRAGRRRRRIRAEDRRDRRAGGGAALRAAERSLRRALARAAPRAATSRAGRSRPTRCRSSPCASARCFGSPPIACSPGRSRASSASRERRSTPTSIAFIASWDCAPRPSW